MTLLEKIITYYRDCFEEENRNGGVWNFFTSKVEHHYLIKDKEEHISGFLPYTPISKKISENINSELAYYKKEKELIYCSLFLLGKYTNMNGKQMRLIAPVVIYDCKIINNDEYSYAQADLKSGTINPTILEVIKSQNKLFDADQFIDQFPTGTITEPISGKIAQLLQKEITNIDTTPIIDYPQNFNKSKILHFFNRKVIKDSYVLVPSSGIGVVKKSISTRSSLSELNLLTNNESSYSQPLQSLFIKNSPQTTGSKNNIINPPCILSTPQKNILETANNFNLSMVIGPPGTGKSFSIANLAIDQINKGKSVLISSRNNGAVDVIEEKINTILDHKIICVRGGRKIYKKKLKDQLQFLLSRGNISESYQYRKKKSTPSIIDFNKRQYELSLINKELESLEDIFFNKEIKELERGIKIHKKDISPTLWNRLNAYFVQSSVQSQKQIDLSDLIKSYTELLETYKGKTKKYIIDVQESRMHNTIIENRIILKNFLQALRASHSARQEQYFESINFNELFKVLPIWLTNTKDVGEILPLQKELFDVVIIDEASQCDISTCIPLLQRAKKAVIVGDPKQLNHISFLSKSRQIQFQKNLQIPIENEEKLDYRNKSILDLCELAIIEQQQVNFLDEHYRSKPEIIAFSNRQFYHNELKIMTTNPNLKTNNLNWVKVNGTRSPKGVNLKESEQIILHLKNTIELEKNLPKVHKSSIGILSPFRAQVDYIIRTLEHELKINELSNHDILVGTAHDFQGEEKDIMLLSFVVDNNTHPSSYYYLSQENVLNVSITRAKNEQYLFTSFDPSNLSSTSIIRDYLESIEKFNRETSHLYETKDKFCNKVNDHLKSIGLKTEINYTIAGIEIDIASISNQRIIGFDLIGYPGEFEKAINLNKYKTLLRANVTLIPITYSMWTYKNELCKEKINSFI